MIITNVLFSIITILLNLLTLILIIIININVVIVLLIIHIPTTHILFLHIYIYIYIYIYISIPLPLPPIQTLHSLNQTTLPHKPIHITPTIIPNNQHRQQIISNNLHTLLHTITIINPVAYNAR